jgi:hypothetical protein
MATIPPLIREHVAIPIVDGKMSFADVCLVASALPDGYAQVTPRGSVMAYDEYHLALWERGRGSTNAGLKDGTRLTVFMRRSALRQAGVSSSGVVRFYGVASLHRSGATYDEIWRRLIDAEKQQDPERKGFGVLIAIERIEDLAGKPLHAS